MYSFEEPTDILIYEECQKNLMRTKNVYTKRYPNCTQPSRQTFKNV